MSQEYRLKKDGFINRDKKILFTFNGKKMFGYEGDVQGGADQIKNTDTSPNPLKNR